MKKILRVMILPAFVFILCSILILPVNAAKKNAAPMGNNDLKLHYGAKKTLGLFETDYKQFTKLVGNTGAWEDADKYQYTWNDGQAAFIKTGEMEKPELVQIVLEDNFKTPRGIKKDSSLSELIKAYPEYSETTEGGNGLWYVFKWTATSKSPFVNGKEFSLSFFVEDDKVKSVLLKLAGEETAEIPVG